MHEQMLKSFRLLLAALLLLSPLPVLAQVPGLPAPAADEATAPPDSQEALKNLITVLKDDTARQELIDRLETEIAPPEQAPADEADSLPADALTVGGRIGEMTQQSAEAVSHSLQQFWRQLLSFPTLVRSFTTSDYGAIGRVLASLLLLVVGTYGTFLLVRLVTQRFRDRLRLRGAREGWLAASIAVIVLLATNLALVVFAWAVGYVLALVLIGEAGELAFYHTLFLNAFLVTEGVQAVIHALLAPRRAELRLLPVGDEVAYMLTRWCRITISVLAFGNLLVAPLLTRNIGPAVGRAGAALVYLLVLVLVLNLILRIREPVTRRLKKATGNSNSQVLRILARSWHIPVMLYVLALIGVALTQPEGVLLGLLLATAKVLVAVIVGMIVANLLTRVILSGVKLPQNVSQRVPLLERRLNAFVPRLLSILRFVVVIAVVGFALDTLGLFDVSGWLESDAGLAVTSAAVTVLLIAVVAFLAWLTLNSWIDYRIEPTSRRSAAVRARERTLLILVRNAATIAIVVFAGMFILSEIGLNIAPLLASAGVIGLAIGFGAQKLVQDIITGIFIQMEGAIDVGDVVTVAGISGGVERLTIRSVALRDLSGAYHIIPFSSVDTVTNSTRGFSQAVLDIGVAYRENIDEVKAAMEDAFAILKTDETLAPDILDNLEWLGVNSLGDSAVVVRARIKTNPGKHWGMTRAYNAIVKRVFDERGIEIPYPHQTIYFGEDKKGRAPPVHVVSDKSSGGVEPAPQSSSPSKPAADAAVPPRPRRRRSQAIVPPKETDKDGEDDEKD